MEATITTTTTASSTSSSFVAKSARTSLKRSRILFSNNDPQHNQDETSSSIIPPVDPLIYKHAVARRIRMNYPVIPSSSSAAAAAEGGEEGAAESKSTNSTANVIREMREEAIESLRNGGTQKASCGQQLVVHREVDVSASGTKSGGGAETALALPGQTVTGEKEKPGGNILVKKKSSLKIPTPKWHAPWQLCTVLSSHLGWVRSIAFDPTNDMFATGAADRCIKVFDLAKACVGAEDALKITLTGHISPIRGLAFSERHPYLFSAGEDKMVKCWDLETNQVIRHYHGHLSGVFALKLHPTLDLLITGGRDAVARVWDMRSKQQVHCLTGHDNTVGAILTKTSDPQVITGSYDSTIKLWDLAAGKCMTTLTHHKKSIRALVQPSYENTFLSGARDTLKKWQGKDGRFLQNFTGHNSVINSLALNDDGVLVSGGDDGSIKFWDYGTGYCFQEMETIAQPGSLDAENGVFCSEFDLTGTRLITGEADKSIKIWKQVDEASEMTDPIDTGAWRKKCLAESKQRF